MQKSSKESEVRIQVELAKQAHGTRAHVEDGVIFKSRRTYVCHKATKLCGGSWIDENSGLAADWILESRLNEAAQAAANLAPASKDGVK
jgi:hypothetical protein